MTQEPNIDKPTKKGARVSVDLRLEVTGDMTLRHALTHVTQAIADGLKSIEGLEVTGLAIDIFQPRAQASRRDPAHEPEHGGR